MKTQTLPTTDARNVLPFPSILQFPSSLDSAGRRALCKGLLEALRFSRSPVVVDLSGCSTLNHEDIDLLLQCVMEVAARDMGVLFVAGSRVNRVLLEVTRISSLVPVFNSVKEALGCPQMAPAQFAPEDDAEDQSQRLRSA